MQKLERDSIIPIKETISAIKQFISEVSVLPRLEMLKMKKSKRTQLFGKDIRLGSLRLQTFAEYGVTCICCNKEATHFAIERHIENEQYHINLYSTLEDGSELLFTHDHTLARSLGGVDNISNTQPMCTECNSDKSIGERKTLTALRSKKETLQVVA
jgi:hypothetical protein